MSSTPTAEDPTRYTPVHEDAMVCESDGSYVRYDDYVKLRALVQELVDAANKARNSGDAPFNSVNDLALYAGLKSAASQGFTPTNTTEG